MAKYSPKTKLKLKELVDDLSIHLGDIDTSAIADMSYLFNDSERTDFSGIEKWDTSNVVSMEGMFYDSYFNHNINDWNVSCVSNMYCMFSNTPFNQPLDKWNTSSVCTMANMFENSPFNQPIGNWNVCEVDNMCRMFSSTPFNQPLNDWDTSMVASMEYMFYRTPFNQPLDKWNTSNVEDMSNMFCNTPFNQPINNWNVSNVSNMSGMFEYSAFNQSLDKWNVSSVKYMSNMFAHSAFNQPLDKWKTSKVVEIKNMFDNTKFFMQNIDSWDISKVSSDDIKKVFKNLTQSQRKTLKLPNWWLKNFDDSKNLIDLNVFDALVIGEQRKEAYMVELHYDRIIEIHKKYPDKLTAMADLAKSDNWNYKAVIGYSPNAISASDLKFFIGMDKEQCESICKNSFLAIVATLNDDKINEILGVFDTKIDALESIPYKDENCYLGYQPTSTNDILGKSFSATQKAFENICIGVYGQYWWVEVDSKDIITKIIKVIELEKSKSEYEESGCGNLIKEAKQYKDDLPKASDNCRFELIEAVEKDDEDEDECYDDEDWDDDEDK
ncbi:BspA family leucine-rich repeat surface protein [Helicobacter sp. 23-1046]